MSLTVHLALVFHIFIAVAVMVMVCGRDGLWRHGIGPFDAVGWVTGTWEVCTAACRKADLLHKQPDLLL